MLKITKTRALLFWSVVLAAGLVFHQVWNRQSAADKWLYLFGRDAATYATALLHSDSPATVPRPEALNQTQIIPRTGHVLFVAWDDTLLAFSTGGAPPGNHWRRVKHNWYVQTQP